MQDEENVDLFSPMYNEKFKECDLCLYMCVPELREKMYKLEKMLLESNSKFGSGFRTCVELVMDQVKRDESMSLFHKFSVDDMTLHFDCVFGSPMCGYNRLKTYDFFSLFDSSTISNESYVRFIYQAYKQNRSSSLCPYALLSVYVYTMMESKVGEMFKKKHDYLWMYNCLQSHNIRLGRLQ